MADEEKDTEEVAEEPKKKSPIILVVILVLIGLVLAGGISFFITTKMMADTATEQVNEHHDPGKFIKLGDAKDGIMVNVGGQKAGKFLKAGIVLEMNPGKKSQHDGGRCASAGG
jgi:flagellar FliL protein